MAGKRFSFGTSRTIYTRPGGVDGQGWWRGLAQGGNNGHWYMVQTFPAIERLVGVSVIDDS